MLNSLVEDVAGSMLPGNQQPHLEESGREHREQVRQSNGTACVMVGWGEGSPSLNMVTFNKSCIQWYQHNILEIFCVL